MKYFLFSIIFIFVFLLCLSGLAEEWEIPEDLLISIYSLDGGPEFLTKVINQIDKDQAEINTLRDQRDTLRQDIYVAKAQINSLTLDVQNTKGLYAGVVLGYPLFTGIGIIEYRFPRWSPMIVGGYSQSAFIGAGINIKVGK